jgi:hypothetical protein
MRSQPQLEPNPVPLSRAERRRRARGSAPAIAPHGDPVHGPAPHSATVPQPRQYAMRRR